jgi:hypothetical protein
MRFVCGDLVSCGLQVCRDGVAREGPFEAQGEQALRYK